LKRAHNPKVAGSNPAPATIQVAKIKGAGSVGRFGRLRPTMKVFDPPRLTATRDVNARSAKSGHVAHFWYGMPVRLHDPFFIGSVTARREPFSDGALHERFGLQARWVHGPTREFPICRGSAAAFCTRSGVRDGAKTQSAGSTVIGLSASHVHRDGVKSAPSIRFRKMTPPRSV
jgi:hypothetical protein